MAQLSPYINFKGNCTIAMKFYKECFGGALHMQPVAGTPMEAQCPPAMKDQILHSTLTSKGILLMASDMEGPAAFVQGNNIAIAVNCDTEEEIRTIFQNPSAGGIILEDLKRQFWGGLFGTLTDQFGIRWIFNFEAK